MAAGAYIFRIRELIFYGLFFVIPFVQTATISRFREFSDVSVLPDFVVTLAGTFRWVFIVTAFFFVVFSLKKIPGKLFFFIYIIFFYLVQFLYSLVSFSELAVYTVLLVESVTIPVFVFFVLKDYGIRYRLLLHIILFFILISIYLNFGTSSLGFRFIGFLNNPNLYGIIALFWLSILLISSYDTSRFERIIRQVLIILCIATIILTQSRNALIGLFVILIFTYFRDWTKWGLFICIFVFVIFFFNSFLSIYFDIDRLLDFEGAAFNSGRANFWENAIKYIRLDPLWGYGMDACEKLLNTGNVHNNYLRYLFTMGTVFSSVIFVSLYLFVVGLLRNRNDFPGSLLGFIISFIIANYGEDYFVGPGSASLVVFFISIGICMYYIERNTRDFSSI